MSNELFSFSLRILGHTIKARSQDMGRLDSSSLIVRSCSGHCVDGVPMCKSCFLPVVPFLCNLIQICYLCWLITLPLILDCFITRPWLWAFAFPAALCCSWNALSSINPGQPLSSCGTNTSKQLCVCVSQENRVLLSAGWLLAHHLPAKRIHKKAMCCLVSCSDVMELMFYLFQSSVFICSQLRSCPTDYASTIPLNSKLST